MILLDTNMLARMTDSAHPQCADARRSVHVLLAQQERLVLFPQNLYEFWAVATRSAGPPPQGRNGLGMTTEQASQWIQFFRRRFTVLSDRPELVETWLSFVTKFAVKGFRSHDVRLAAAMQTYGVRRLLTFNGDDFKDFPIDIVDPVAV